MAENEAKKKSTTKKTTSTNPRATKNTSSSNEAKERLEEIPVEPAIMNTANESIEQVRKDLNNSVKGVANTINSGTNNILLTIKAESAKMNSLIKDQIQNIDLSSIDECLKTYKKLETWQLNIIEKMDIIYDEYARDVEQLEDITKSLNELNDKINLIMDAITNDPNNDLTDHIEQMLVAQNTFMKDLMEKNNDRINLNSERLNMVISSVSNMSKNICDNHDTQIDLINKIDVDISKVQHNLNAGFDKIDCHINDRANALEEMINDLEKQNASDKSEYMDIIKDMDRRIINRSIINTAISMIIFILVSIILTEVVK